MLELHMQRGNMPMRNFEHNSKNFAFQSPFHVTDANSTKFEPSKNFPTITTSTLCSLKQSEKPLESSWSSFLFKRYFTLTSTLSSSHHFFPSWDVIIVVYTWHVYNTCIEQVIFSTLYAFKDLGWNLLKLFQSVSLTSLFLLEKNLEFSSDKRYFQAFKKL